MKKGVWRSEIALEHFFLGGKPWKRESGNLRLLSDYFLNILFRRQALKNGVWRCEIALGLISYFFLRRQALKKCSLEIWDCSGIIFLFFFKKQALKKWVWRFEIALRLYSFFFLGVKPWKEESGDLRLLRNYFLFFFGGASLGQGNPEIWDSFGIILLVESLWKREFFFHKLMF